ncbi:MAG: hypothetical protein Q4A16_11395 [Lautropia sp.]|nr:hypothetical protein [Lautropia sp.]
MCANLPDAPAVELHAEWWVEAQPPEVAHGADSAAWAVSDFVIFERAADFFHAGSRIAPRGLV